jgi:hypothetical protein
VKHIRTIGKVQLPKTALNGGLKALKEEKKPPVNATMSL